MRMRTKRLYSRIYLHALGVLLVVGLATTSVFSFGQRGAFLREVAERLGRHLLTELGERFTDVNARQTALDSLHRDFELELTLRDVDGRVLAAAGSVMPPFTASELGTLRRGEGIFQRWAGVAGAPIREPRSGALLGFLQMSPPHRFHSFALASLGRPLLAVALVLLLVALASLPLARRISRPVELLTIASRRLGAGELSYRIPLREKWPHPPAVPCHHIPGIHGRMHHRHAHMHRPPDEVEELMLAWNDMADRIERLLRGQRELLANISHELRSPLTRVRVALALLPREGETDARLSEVEADLGELERLIEDVLMTSRLEATGLPTHPSPVALRPLLAQVLERARNAPLVAGKSVAVAPGDEVTLLADATLLKRALFNLVENAAKYGASPIVVAAQQREGSVEISVTDEGEGIPVAERERVLEPFYRRDKAHTQHAPGSAAHGFGLGLTLARRVAEAHGGTISIAPARLQEGQDKGCRVTLRLPIDVADAPGAAQK
jgi:two-component system OmpR family sensor kinase